MIERLKSKEINLNAICLKYKVRSVDKEHVEKLIKSIKKKGVLNPPKVALYKGHYWLVAGYHRRDALKKLGIKSTECDIFRVDSFDDMDYIAETDNEHMETKPIDKAKKYVWIAERTGQDPIDVIISNGYCSGRETAKRLLLLLTVPPRYHDRIITIHNAGSKERPLTRTVIEIIHKSGLSQEEKEHIYDKIIECADKGEVLRKREVQKIVNRYRNCPSGWDKEKRWRRGIKYVKSPSEFEPTRDTEKKLDDLKSALERIELSSEDGVLELYAKYSSEYSTTGLILRETEVGKIHVIGNEITDETMPDNDRINKTKGNIFKIRINKLPKCKLIYADPLTWIPMKWFCGLIKDRAEYGIVSLQNWGKVRGQGVNHIHSLAGAWGINMPSTFESWITHIKVYAQSLGLRMETIGYGKVYTLLFTNSEVESLGGN